MTQIKEPVHTGLVNSGKMKCIFCHQDHKAKKQKPLENHVFTRSDTRLTTNGRAFIKATPSRAAIYPRDENGAFVSPLEPATWSDDVIFKTYKTSSGEKRPHAEKYQAPPIMGWIAAPHHMIAICCLNGENGLPSVPKVNPWAKRGEYDANNGGNCIFLPSSASQFFVAYYYWKVRRTGQALQGHLGAHRKEYFETVWDRLEKMVRDLAKTGWCNDAEADKQKEHLPMKVREKLAALEESLFKKISALKPEEKYRLGAESYIEIPDESAKFKVPAGVLANLQPYETLPKWY